MSEKPERIWVGTVTLTAGVASYPMRVWDIEPTGRVWEPTEYVLATTHQRTVDALREAEREIARLVKARDEERAYRSQRFAEYAVEVAGLRHELSRIKETTP